MQLLVFEYTSPAGVIICCQHLSAHTILLSALETLLFPPMSNVPHLSWPKTPSVPPVSCDEHESECRKWFLVEKSGCRLIRIHLFRQFEASFGVNLSVLGTSNRPGRWGA